MLPVTAGAAAVDEAAVSAWDTACEAGAGVVEAAELVVALLQAVADKQIMIADKINEIVFFMFVSPRFFICVQLHCRDLTL